MASGRGGALRLMAAGWGVFTGSHLVMSHPPVREQLVKSLGEKQFLGVYSLAAAASFFPTTFLYLRYGRGVGTIPGWTALTQRNPVVRGLGLGCKGAAAVCFAQGLATPNTALAIAHGEKGGEGEVEAKGIYRITRHPAFTALAFVGFGNILLRGYAGDVVYWAGYPLIWALGCPHQDYRQRTTGVIPQEYFDKTSFLPFAAIAEGRNSWEEAWKEFNKPALATALIVPIFFL